MSDKMTIGQKVLGMVSTNCYFLLNKETKEMIIVDPADDAVAIDGIVHKDGRKAGGYLADRNI